MSTLAGAVPLIKGRLTPTSLPPALPTGQSYTLGACCVSVFHVHPESQSRTTSALESRLETGWEMDLVPRTPCIGSSLNTDVFQTNLTFLKTRSPIPSGCRYPSFSF